MADLHNPADSANLLPYRLRNMGLQTCNEAANEIERLRALLRRAQPWVHNLHPLDEDIADAIGAVADDR